MDIKPRSYLSRPPTNGRTEQAARFTENLMASARRKPRAFDRVVVFSKSRLSRSSLQELKITSQSENHAIEVVSASEPFHTMKGSGRVAAESAIRMVNEVYLAQVAEHVKRGQIIRPPGGLDNVGSLWV